MKKNRGALIAIILVVISIVILLNIEVSTCRGINYEVSIIKIPLYLKVLDFFDRHYNYNQLVKSIVKDVKTEEERVMKIFEWTYKNIREVPAGMPIIDDHVWHIIVRGYGASDQFSDVFTTLCNYAGLDAFYSWVYTQDRTKRIPLSFVRIKNKWYIFDPYHGAYFKDKKGRLADIETLKSNSIWTIETLTEKSDIDYKSYFNMLLLPERIGLKRAHIQFPLRRTIFEIKKIVR